MSGRIARLVFSSCLAFVLLFVFLQLTTLAVSQSETANIIISELAWAGTQDSPYDEWIELYNAGAVPVDLSGWTIHDSSGDISVTLEGPLSPGAFYLLERTDDTTVSDVDADQIYTGNLNNGGETITLRNDGGAVVDSANAGGGSWPGGIASPDYVSMERVSPEANDEPEGWQSNDQITMNGVDAGGQPIHGTPRAPNSGWEISPDDAPDLTVSLEAPGTTLAGEDLRYDIHVANAGEVHAHDVTITATLAPGLTYANDDSGMAPDPTQPQRPVWNADSLDAGSELSFALTATVGLTVEGSVVGRLRASSAGEVQGANNVAQAETVIVPDAPPSVLIGALLYDGYELQDADEAVQLVNTEPVTVDLGGWIVSDGDNEATLDGSVSIGPGASLWLAQDEQAFARQFGFEPDVVLDSWPGFANVGDEVLLYGPYGNLVDSLIYKNGDTSTGAWQGPAVWPYGGPSLFAEEGQLLFRRREEGSGLPVDDSNQAGDWAQMMADTVVGRRVQYPGWSLERFYQPAVSQGTETVTVAVAPDNGYQLVVQQIESARRSIEIEMLTLENVAIG
ncbi:MAG: lamin tail domain-containing protein, partial [Chloroflexota bacterium]